MKILYIIILFIVISVIESCVLNVMYYYSLFEAPHLHLFNLKLQDYHMQNIPNFR